MSYWMGETIAHTIVSFGFEKSGAAPRTTAAITVAGMAVTTAPIMVGRLSSPPAIRAPALPPVRQTVPRLLPQLMPQPAPTITRRPITSRPPGSGSAPRRWVLSRSSASSR